MLTCPAPALLKQAIQSPSRAQLADHIPTTSRSPVVIISSSNQYQSFHKGSQQTNEHALVGSRTTRAPGDLEAHFRWHGDAPRRRVAHQAPLPPGGDPGASGTRAARPSRCGTPVTHPGSWRAVWGYSSKRFTRDNHTLDAQENRARAVIAGDKRPKSTRFVTTHKADQVLDEASLARARRLAGLKGYVTNMPTRLMDAAEVVSSYHELWHARAVIRR